MLVWIPRVSSQPSSNKQIRELLTTKGDTLTFLMYHLSLKKSKRIQETLRAELFATFPHSSAINDPEFYVNTLSKTMLLPYLDAVLKETLRIYTAIPITLPRVVPPLTSTTQSKFKESKIKKNGRYIEGYFLPAGTIVGSFAHGIHRDKKVFVAQDRSTGGADLSGVDDFYPERWLVGEGRNILGLSADFIQHEEERIRIMERRFWAFGSGGRGCVGKQ